MFFPLMFHLMLIFMLILLYSLIYVVSFCAWSGWLLWVLWAIYPISHFFVLLASLFFWFGYSSHWLLWSMCHQPSVGGPRKELLAVCCWYFHPFKWLSFFDFTLREYPLIFCINAYFDVNFCIHLFIVFFKNNLF